MAKGSAFWCVKPIAVGLLGGAKAAADGAANSTMKVEIMVSTTCTADAGFFGRSNHLNYSELALLGRCHNEMIKCLFIAVQIVLECLRKVKSKGVNNIKLGKCGPLSATVQPNT